MLTYCNQVSGHGLDSVGSKSPITKKFNNDSKHERHFEASQSESTKKQQVGGQFREVGGQNTKVSDEEEGQYLGLEWKHQHKTESSHVQGRKTQFQIHQLSDENQIVGGHNNREKSKGPQNPTSELDIGDRVVISGEQHGVLRYLGPTHFQVKILPS